MSKKSKKSVYQIVTDRIVEALDNGVVPWSKPWKGGYALPYNMFSMDPEKGKFYQGANVPLLWLSGHSDPRWMTYTQAKKNGIEIKDGEKPHPVVFWKFLEKKDDNGVVEDTFPVLRYFRVYNAQQCEGVPEMPEIADVDPSENHEHCQAMIDIYGVKVKHGGHKASYDCPSDTIKIPEAGAFNDVEGYWATLLHEAIHSTGHSDRLNMNLDSEDRESYAFEELVAEIGSAFLCAQMGIERDELIQNHASYIAGWKSVITSDPRAFMRASKLARQASDYVLECSGASDYTVDEEDEEAA